MVMYFFPTNYWIIQTFRRRKGQSSSTGVWGIMGPTQALQSPKGHRIHSKTSQWKQNGEGMYVYNWFTASGYVVGIYFEGF